MFNRLRQRLYTIWTKKGDGKRNVLTYDVVGGTSDVPILTIGAGFLEVKAKNMDMSPSSFFTDLPSSHSYLSLREKFQKHQREESESHVYKAKLHLHEDVEQDLRIEIQLQDAHRRDHGPDRDENGSSGEAAAHHAPKQIIHDMRSTQKTTTIAHERVTQPITSL